MTEGDEEKRNKDALLQKAQLLMELRNYHEENLCQSDMGVDIEASTPDSEGTVVMRIVTTSTLKSNGVGVGEVEEAEQILEEANVDRVIVFGTRFTKAARRDLREKGIEFFSQTHRIASTLSPQEVYSRIQDGIDEVCHLTCGYTPQSEADCEGYSEKVVTCSVCGGSGTWSTTANSYWERTCPVCGGAGEKEGHYSCAVRLLSDNVDLHFTHGWISLLQQDLSSLLQILRTSKHEAEEQALATMQTITG